MLQEPRLGEERQRMQGPGERVGALLGHRGVGRPRDTEPKRENWPGEGDSRTKELRYGPTIDKREERPLPFKMARELREMERAVQDRFGTREASEGWVERLKGIISGEALWDEARRFQLRHRSEVVDEFGFDPKFADHVAPALTFLYNRYFRVSMKGADHLPSTGRALVVANHSGTLPLDAAMIQVGLHQEHEAHRMVRPLVEDFVFHSPLLGTLIRRIGGVRANFENAERLLVGGQLAAVFPEGIQGVGKRFRERYRLKRFGRGGFVKLALKTRSPIVPVAVVGAEETYPLLGKLSWFSRSTGIPFLPVTPTFPWLGPLGLLPLPTKWTISVGAPIYVHEQFGSQDWNNRILVNKVAEQVRSTIQSMVDDSLRTRRSVFFG